MTQPKPAWLGVALLSAVSVAALAVAFLPAPAPVDTTPAQTVAAAEQVNSTPSAATTGLELLARAVVNTDQTPAPALAPAAEPLPAAAAAEPLPAAAAAQPLPIAATEQRPDPAPVLRGAEVPAFPAPTASVAATPGRHWHDGKTESKTTGVASPIRKPGETRAEMPGKRPRATGRACAPSSPFESWLRKLNLAPRCAS
jgi:hypothetical protein